jgi:hypothetical protein
MRRKVEVGFMRRRLKLLVFVLFVALAATLSALPMLARPASAKPAFMDRYDRDPYSKAVLRGRCTVCHVGRGGGERNDFGEAFEDAGYRITPKLRAKFPSVFEPER